METKREVMQSIAKDYLQVCQITDLSDVESALGRIIERYDNAPCDEFNANDNTRKQQIEELARELFVHNQTIDTDKCFQYAELFYSDIDERNKETDK